MTHYIKQAKAEIARLEGLLRDERARPTLDAFANQLGQSILVCLACMPFDTWPQVAQTAFEHEARKAPNAAALYRANLPTKSDWWQP
jgi:hypothetical protein